MQKQENTKELFDKELEKLKPNTVLSPEYRRKKVMIRHCYEISCLNQTMLFCVLISQKT